MARLNIADWVRTLPNGQLGYGLTSQQAATLGDLPRRSPDHMFPETCRHLRSGKAAS